MKAIMKSIKPKPCANIMNLIQSILVIKNKREASAIQKLIDENGYADIYVYCRKDTKDYLVWGINLIDDSIVYGTEINVSGERNGNGKVMFKFRCYKVEEIRMFPLSFKDYNLYRTSTIDFDDFEKASCLSKQKLGDYLKGKTGYAIHISDLLIFEKPKKLNEFERYGSWRLYQKTCPKALQGRCNHGKSLKYGYAGCEKARLTHISGSYSYIEE